MTTPQPLQVAHNKTSHRLVYMRILYHFSWTKVYFISSYQKSRQQICTNLHKSICEDECGFVRTSHMKGAHFSTKRCALLSLEFTTPRQPPYTTCYPFVAQRSIVCCATKSAPPPKLRTSKSPSNESKKLCGLRGLCVSLNWCQMRRPTNFTQLLSHSDSKLLHLNFSPNHPIKDTLKIALPNNALAHFWQHFGVTMHIFVRLVNNL